jgi:hypothetical protein
MIQTSLITDQTEAIDVSHERAKGVFEIALGDLPWADVYASMIAAGFRWREAAYVGWAVQPAKNPPTKKELSELLGCSMVTLSKFASNPKLQAMQFKLSKLAYIEHLPAIIAQSVLVATTEGYKGTAERNLILKAIMGIGTDRVQVSAVENDLSQMTNEELMMIANGDADE